MLVHLYEKKKQNSKSKIFYIRIHKLKVELKKEKPLMTSFLWKKRIKKIIARTLPNKIIKLNISEKLMESLQNHIILKE